MAWKFLFSPKCIYGAVDHRAVGRVVAHLGKGERRAQHVAGELPSTFGVIGRDAHPVVITAGAGETVARIAAFDETSDGLLLHLTLKAPGSAWRPTHWCGKASWSTRCSPSSPRSRKPWPRSSRRWGLGDDAVRHLHLLHRGLAEPGGRPRGDLDRDVRIQPVLGQPHRRDARRRVVRLVGPINLLAEPRSDLASAICRRSSHPRCD